jgi:hypothetical protein
MQLREVKVPRPLDYKVDTVVISCYVEFEETEPSEHRQAP